jgi:hypothetical protein
MVVVAAVVMLVFVILMLALGIEVAVAARGLPVPSRELYPAPKSNISLGQKNIYREPEEISANFTLK